MNLQETRTETQDHSFFSGTFGVKCIWGQFSDCIVFFVLIEHNIIFIFDKDALSKASIGSPERVSGIVIVIIFQDTFDVLCGDGLIVKRNRREKVVRDLRVLRSPTSLHAKRNTYMIVADVMEENSSGPTKEGTIDGRESTAKEGPLRIPIHWDCRIGVVQVREAGCANTQRLQMNTMTAILRRNIW